jgi:hypothetical protein
MRQFGRFGNGKQAEQPLLKLMAAGSNASPGRYRRVPQAMDDPDWALKMPSPPGHP